MTETGRARAPEGRELADFVVGVLDDMKAQDIRLLDVRHLTALMDFMVVATGRSDRHVRAVSGAVVDRCKAAGIKPYGIEGEEAGEWVLVDLADVVVHVMLGRVREFYNIERLWEMPARAAGSEEEPG